MAAYVPPLNINIVGNRCGGCCSEPKLRREAAPLNYIVVTHSDKSFGAVPYSKMDPVHEAEVAKAIFGEFQKHLRVCYGFEWDDLPAHIKPSDCTRAPSVAQLKNAEAVAMGFAEGFKRASSGGSTPKIRKSESSTSEC